MDKSTQRAWFKGLVAAIIGGAANSVALIVVDPIAFDPLVNFMAIGKVALVGAIISVAAYLKKSPIPE